MPSDEEQEALLVMAGVAAHTSERTAAPLSTWLVGRARLSALEAKRIVEQVANAAIQGEGPSSGARE